ncbi:MAG: hypothetical protein Q9207_004495 [Kuettlingeria erythrocarpa]
MEFEAQRKQDSEDFWKVEADDHEFWDAYIASRPNYSQSFYNIIHDYHSAHSSSNNVAHDVGCGTGRVAAELALHYPHIIASDVEADHLAVAKSCLTSLPGSISYTHSRAEELASHHPPSSADLIAAAEVVVLMDRDAGLASFSQILKPGGTLAVWFYGRPTFSDSTLFAHAQPILDKIMARNWKDEWDIGQLKEYFRVLFPGFRQAIGEGDEQLNALFAELAEAMGEGRRQFTWPVALVLATRR